jgi:hypothetical protein
MLELLLEIEEMHITVLASKNHVQQYHGRVNRRIDKCFYYA